MLHFNYMNCYREKLAYITTVKMQVPVIPTDSTSPEEPTASVTMETAPSQPEETKMLELLKDDDREGLEV